MRTLAEFTAYGESVSIEADDAGGVYVTQVSDDGDRVGAMALVHIPAVLVPDMARVLGRVG